MVLPSPSARLAARWPALYPDALSALLPLEFEFEQNPYTGCLIVHRVYRREEPPPADAKAEGAILSFAKSL
jgi:hypothetical protein